MAANPRLVYGRMTGWGQEGPLASTAGHDGNYSALSGALAAIGDASGPPVIPLNLVADFGGGGAYLAIGILAALLETGRSGKGQIVDAAMVDGAASLMTLFYGMHAGGAWRDERGANLLDGAAPFYGCYKTKDDGYIVICAIEPRFFAELLEVLEVSDIDPVDQFDEDKWTVHRRTLEAVIARKTRDEWCDLFAGKDACFAPVLSLAEAPRHPHNEARNTFTEVDGIVQPGPAPRFSRTNSVVSQPAGDPDPDIRAVLAAWGLSGEDIDGLLEK
jgi:alpha-methylacyl-CoA racemase